MIFTSINVVGQVGWKSMATRCVENMSRDLILCKNLIQIVASSQTLYAPISFPYGLITPITRHGQNMRHYFPRGAQAAGPVTLTKAQESMTKACTEALRSHLMIRVCARRKEVLSTIQHVQLTGCGPRITRTGLRRSVSSASQGTTKTQRQTCYVSDARPIP